MQAPHGWCGVRHSQLYVGTSLNQHGRHLGCWAWPLLSAVTTNLYHAPLQGTTNVPRWQHVFPMHVQTVPFCPTGPLELPPASMLHATLVRHLTKSWIGDNRSMPNSCGSTSLTHGSACPLPWHASKKPKLLKLLECITDPAQDHCTHEVRPLRTRSTTIQNQPRSKANSTHRYIAG